MYSLNQAIKEFTDHCRFEKNLSSKTIKSYSIDLKQLTDFLVERKYPLKVTRITKTELREFLESISSLKPKSIKRKVATIKAMFNYLEFEDRIPSNPISILVKRVRLVYYHSDKKKCDFVTKAGTRITEAIQVSYELTDENKDREVKGLVEALDKYKLNEGTIITFDREETISTGRKKIRVLPAWKWLIE